MNERVALEQVTDKYGSLEEFALFCLTDGKAILQTNVSITKKAKVSGVDADALNFILQNSEKFRALMRSVLVNKEFDLAQERNHVKTVVGIATNAGRKVVTNKGNTVSIDNTERGVLDAGRYLNELRNTPVKSGEGSNTAPVTIIFGAAGGEQKELDDDGKTITVDGGTLKRHSPLKAGALPPPAVRARYTGPDAKQKPPFGDSAIGTDVDFDSTEAPGSEDIEPRINN